MTNKTIEGREVKFWDFNLTREVEIEENGEKVKKTVVESGWNSKPSILSVAVPDSFEEVLTQVGNGDEKRVLALVEKGLIAEAEEKAGSTPAGTFSKSMVNAAHGALKVSPQFAAIKSSKDRKDAIMKWISANDALKGAYLTAFEPLRNAGDSDSDE